jgi:hypothetical protein
VHTGRGWLARRAGVASSQAGWAHVRRETLVLAESAVRVFHGEAHAEEDIEEPRALGAQQAVREEVEAILWGDLDRVHMRDILGVERELDLVETERSEQLVALRGAESL